MSRKRPQPPVKPFKKKPNPLKAAKVTEIDYKDVACCVSSSPIAARFVPVVSPVSPCRSSARSPRLSRTPARWPCCRTPRPAADLREV